MTDREDLWCSVHACLDAGSDPLLDPAVQRALAAAPDQLAAVVALRARLCALPALAPRPARRRPLEVAAAGLVLVLAATAAVWALRAPAPPHPGVPLPRLSDRGAVWVTGRGGADVAERPGGRSRLERGRLTARQVTRSVRQSDPTPAFPAPILQSVLTIEGCLP